MLKKDVNLCKLKDEEKMNQIIRQLAEKTFEVLNDKMNSIDYNNLEKISEDPEKLKEALKDIENKKIRVEALLNYIIENNDVIDVEVKEEIYKCLGEKKESNSNEENIAAVVDKESSNKRYVEVSEMVSLLSILPEGPAKTEQGRIWAELMSNKGEVSGLSKRMDNIPYLLLKQRLAEIVRSILPVLLSIFITASICWIMHCYSIKNSHYSE